MVCVAQAQQQPMPFLVAAQVSGTEGGVAEVGSAAAGLVAEAGATDTDEL